MTKHPFFARAALLAPFVACLAQALPAQAADIANPGEYEWTMKTNDDPVRTVKTCMTLEMAKMFNGDSASGRAAAEKADRGRCAIQAYEIAGNKVSYRIACGDRLMESTTTFRGDTSEGDLTTTRTAEGARRVDHTHTTAKRIGACK
jgi:hypothetical protein